MITYVEVKKTLRPEVMWEGVHPLWWYVVVLLAQWTRNNASPLRVTEPRALSASDYLLKTGHQTCDTPPGKQHKAQRTRSHTGF